MDKDKLTKKTCGQTHIHTKRKRNKHLIQSLTSVSGLDFVGLGAALCCEQSESFNISIITLTPKQKAMK